MFAKLRGFVDAISLAVRLLFRGGSFAREYVEQIDTIARTQYAHLDRITAPLGQTFPRPVSNFPTTPPPPPPTLPKGPAQRP
jgi:hypothetical protein